MPTGTITFSRNCLLDTEIPDFEKSDKKFGKIVLQPKGTIEDCFGALQVIKSLNKIKFRLYCNTFLNE